MELLKHSNVHNLTDLWKVGGLLAGKFISENEVFVSLGSQGDWPDKVWITGSLNSKKLLAVQSLSKGKPCSLAVWEKEIQEDLLAEFGFHSSSELVGMSCDLASFSSQTTLPIQLQLVKTPKQALIWSQVFFHSFGYEIPPSTVIALGEKVSFYTASFEDNPIGTSMVFQDSRGVSGIYSIGVAPSFRGKGLANHLFEATLSKVKKAGATTAILQASAMGLGLYLKYGFRSDFKIRFYKN
ncbi:GNAT family N-acetyltransferase [Algoriphagus lutimaris]|uniref:GNAT family N-acetyltransferase n=1 Tax=Algoriphagus lutimaris TaxID=613197 RepID=UPI00196A3D4C|nr:GNAT family N-acetyltransferase [Algoriphagus lutimaris]MBN3520228.1 GNAT family N-acetyltransferase [Algoriphagus lutimaris]